MSVALQRDGIRALPYHAGLTNEQRTENQASFIRDDVPVLVATIAFYKGLNVREGSREISQATTQSVVNSVIAVTLANVVVTSFQLA